MTREKLVTQKKTCAREGCRLTFTGGKSIKFCPEHRTTVHYHAAKERAEARPARTIGAPRTVDAFPREDGWLVTKHPRFYDILVVTAPDGRQYTRAVEGEDVTLIRTFPTQPWMRPATFTDLEGALAVQRAEDERRAEEARRDRD